MRVQDYSLDVSRKAAAEFFKYAAAVPEDRLDWSPMGEGQSVISMCREIAMTPDWAFEVMNGVERSPEEQSAAFEESKSWTSVDQCIGEFEKRFVRWEKFVKELPDERLSETRWLPYEGGRDFTFFELLDYPRWNTTYHLGQVAYVQILYGDREMY